MTRLLQSEHNDLRVFVYFNLHKRVWSVKALEGEHKGKVIGHASVLCLTDCTFKVSQAGRKRVLREQRKNVHAGVVGTLNTFIVLPSPGLYPNWKPSNVTYNPYKYETFVDKWSETPVHHADIVSLDTQRGVEAYGVKVT